MIDNEGENYRD